MKKKIIFIIESFIVGGAEKMLIDIVNHLDSDLYDITVCSIYKYSVYPNYERYFDKPFKEHIHYKYIINNHKRLYYRLSSYMLNRFPSLFYKIMIGDQYDTVIAFYEGQPTHLVGSASIKGKKIAWLHTLTEYSQKNKTNESLINEKKIYQAFDQIVAISKSVLESFDAKFQIQKQKCSIIYNSIDTFTINLKKNEIINHNLIQKINRPLFISVGRMTQVKGYDRIIKVASKLKEKDYPFTWWIIGDGGEKKKLQEEIENNKLTSNIILLGHQSNPYFFMKQADCFVSASYIEGLNITLLEAMSLNIPILVSNIPAHKEVLSYRNTLGGYLFKNESDLLSILEKYLNGQLNIKEYIPIADQIIQQKFLCQTQIEKITNLLL